MGSTVAADDHQPEGRRTDEVSQSPGVPASITALCDLLVDELAASWGHGAGRPVEAFLAEHPEICNYPEAALRLVYEEICVRQETGRSPTRDEILGRFPQWTGPLKVLLECHQLLETPPAPQFPEAGTTWNDFHVVAELGRGAEGRVYLATQPDLVDRPVVLKLTPCRGGEHLSLARLQHTGIVPLYLVHDEPARNLRTLCMPYFGGMTLARLLEELRAVPMGKRGGADIVDAIDRTQARLPSLAGDGSNNGGTPRTGKERLSLKGGARPFLASLSYAEAICWIAGCLAEALQYAHDRGLVHMDVKPSNVLISVDGQPMLLDFHLAQPPLDPAKSAPERVGGTLAYMPREQQAAMTAVNAGRPIGCVVDARADIYSLGVLLYEALGGSIPVLPGVSPPLCKLNPQVSVGLSDIVSKCVGYHAYERYETAGSVASDLKRHLANQPLRGVKNRSWLERWRKWLRRKPHAPRYIAGGAVVLVALAAASYVVLQSLAKDREHAREQAQQAETQIRQARQALENGMTWLADADFGRARAAFERGFGLVRDQAGADDLSRDLVEQQRLALRLENAQKAHREVERKIRYEFGVDRPSRSDMERTRANCEKIWGLADTLLEWADADPPAGTPARVKLHWDVAQRNIRLDLLDVAIMASDLQVRLAEGEQAIRQACRQSLKLLDEAEKRLKDSPALERERLLRAMRLGDKALEKQAQGRLKGLTPKTAWEHFLVGRSLFRAGKLAEAGAALDEAIEMDPHAFWPTYYRGFCAYEQKDYRRAVELFGICIALEEKNPAACYFNRALARKELGDARASLRDLEHALKKGFDPARSHYLMAVIHHDLGENVAAVAHLRDALKANPGHKKARAMQRKLMMR